MKKYIFTLFALFMTFMGARAQEPTTYFVELVNGSLPTGASIAMTYQLGTDATVDVSDNLMTEVAPVPAGATVTLTLTPAQGYAVGTVIGETFMDGSEMRSRTRGSDPAISILGDVTITQSTTNANVFTYTQPTANVRLTISWKKLIQPSWITLTGATDLVYDGTDKEPGVTVKDGGTMLSAETDYDVVYSNNKNACEATAENAPTVTVTMKDGNDTYAGSASVTFAIACKAATITADGDTKVYDGTALTKNSYTNTALAPGDAIESVTITGSQTIVGKSNNVPSAAVIKNADGDDVTGNYAITYANGTLEVTAATMTITAASDSKVYDGTALTKNSYTNTDLASGDAIESVTITGSQTAVGKSDNVPSAAVIKNADGKDVTANYAITYANGTLEVTAATVTITAASDSKVYDGTALTKNSYTNTNLATGDAIESVTITGSQTAVGKSDNVPSAAVIKNADGDDVTANYAITYANGTLEVTAATMTGVTVTNYSGTYDGKAHTIKLDVPKDATVKYGTAEGSYNLDAAPTYKEVGTYTVYFKVTMANYKDYQGSGTVEIKSSGTVIIDGVPYASLTEAAKEILGDLFPEELLIGLVGSTTPEQLNDILSRISVDEIKGIVASQGPALQLILRNLKVGDVLKILADGNLSGAIAKLKLFAGLKVRAKSRTRSAADDTELQIVSGQEYLVLEDCDLIITLHTEDAPVIIQSIIIRTPGDANGDGLVNAADLVEMVKAMNGQASDKFILKNADMDGDGEITEADIDAVRKLIMGE